MTLRSTAITVLCDQLNGAELSSGCKMDEACCHRRSMALKKRQKFDVGFFLSLRCKVGLHENRSIIGCFFGPGGETVDLDGVLWGPCLPLQAKSERQHFVWQNVIATFTALVCNHHITFENTSDKPK